MPQQVENPPVMLETQETFVQAWVRKIPCSSKW